MKGHDIRVFGKLPNGAMVLRWRWDREGHHQVVLCIFNHEYVTWKVDSAGAAYWGHYYQTDLEAAVQDFKTRR